jgi:hypothetical protein
VKIGDFEGYLGEAAEQKHLAKQAIKEERFDDAWRYLHEQKMYYQKHANANNWEYLDFLVLDSVAHEDMANILRIEGKHGNALSNISYTYKTAYTANRPIITLEKKLKAYYNRAYKKNKPFERFLSLLRALPSSDFVSVRDFVEIYYPMAPAVDDNQTTFDTIKGNADLDQEKAQSINSNFFKIREHKKAIASTKPVEIEIKIHPEPKYINTSNIETTQKSPDTFLGHPTSEWILGVIIGGVILMIFIWLLS